MKNIVSIVALFAMALLGSSCMQHSKTPTAMHGDRGLTSGIHVDSVDVQVVTSRVTGKSTGFKILGFIPIKLASETEAVVNMYESARERGCAPEGYARQFVNNSVEHSSNYFILFSRPVIRATGDLIEILPPGAGAARHEATANDGTAAEVATEPAPEPSSKKKQKRRR